MDYVPWPASGCSLAEARERTAERNTWRRRTELLSQLSADPSGKSSAPNRTELRAIEAEITAIYQDHFESGRLIAYGGVDPSKQPNQISSKDWRALTSIDWKNSTTAEQRVHGARLHDIRVFPTLLAACRTEIVEGLPLVEAFRKFVLGDPEVAQLGREAVRLSPKFATVFLEGRCLVRGVEEWPLAFERWTTNTIIHPDPAKWSKFEPRGDPDPIEVIIAAEARVHRYCSLIILLRAGELEAVGAPGIAGAIEPIPRAVWSHRDFDFEPSTGDILQTNRQSNNKYDRHIRRWVGVVLRRPPRRARDVIQSGRSDLSNRPPAERSFDETSVTSRPFTTADAAAVGTLSEALDRLVFQHPNVRALRKAANVAADAQHVWFDENAGLIGQFTGHEEPLLALRYFERAPDLPEAMLEPENADGAAIWAKHFDSEPPAELQAFYDDLDLRALTLIEMLQRRELAARGHTADGHLVAIAQSIWSHPEYYIHPPTGDVYEASSRVMKRRWIGIILEMPAASETKEVFHEKPTVHDKPRPITTGARRSRKTVSKASIEKAVTALWPEGVPDTLLLDNRDEAIRDWLKRKRLHPVHSKTIRRYLGSDGRFFK